MHTECSALRKGIVIVPVADLAGQPLAELFPSHSIEYAYRHLPWSCYRSQYAANGRLHQLLFHEQVTIINQKNNEVCIEVPNVFYTTTRSNTPQTRYWTHAKNIIPLSALSDTDQSAIPPAISFRDPTTLTNRMIVTLMEPWYAKDLDLTFSAGTRFVKTPQKSKSNHIAVYAVDPRTRSIKTIAIPRQLIYHAHATHPQQQIHDFLQLIQRWAHAQSGSIGYVFGGCSYIQTHAKNTFNLCPSILTQHGLSQYERPNTSGIKTGLDCSNLILRAAHIVGLPYFFKNTHTLAQKMRAIKPHECIESGDLIWMPGHVIIISDAQHNQIIEAHSYDGGYGKVHEMPLHAIFKGIATCDDLHAAFKNGTALKRLNSKGIMQQTYQQFKILKLRSLWLT